MKTSVHRLPFILSFLMIQGTDVMSQATATSGNVNKPVVPEIFFSPSFYLVAFVFIILLLAIFSLSKTISLLTYALLPEDQKKKMADEKQKKADVRTDAGTFWTRFDRAVLTKAVPVEKEEDVMLDHNYDGIKELDNSLPPWWLWGFYITIIWSVGYLIHYHVFHTGPSSAEEYNQSVVLAEQQLAEYRRKRADLITAENAQFLNTPEELGMGKEIFTKNCVACHGTDGGGTVGPNLTDEFWIHGGGIKNVFMTISNGVTAKGMIAWKSQLSPKQIQAVSSYVLSLEGSSPASPKAAEGEKWMDEGGAAGNASDTSRTGTATSAVSASL